MTTEPDEFAAYRDMLTEGAIPLCGARIVVGLDSQGHQTYSWAVEGAEHPDKVALLGVLDLLHHHLVTHVTSTLYNHPEGSA